MKKKEPSLNEAFNAIVKGLKILADVAISPLEGGNRDKPKREKKKPKKEKK
jgi:hypothetical protein